MGLHSFELGSGWWEGPEGAFVVSSGDRGAHIAVSGLNFFHCALFVQQSFVR